MPRAMNGDHIWLARAGGPRESNPASMQTLAADLESQDGQTALESQAMFVERHAEGLCLGEEEGTQVARFPNVFHRNRPRLPRLP